MILYIYTVMTRPTIFQNFPRCFAVTLDERILNFDYILSSFLTPLYNSQRQLNGKIKNEQKF